MFVATDEPDRRSICVLRILCQVIVSTLSYAHSASAWDLGWPIMRELINLLVLPLLALIVLALYFYPDRLEDLISWVQDFFHN